MACYPNKIGAKHEQSRVCFVLGCLAGAASVVAAAAALVSESIQQSDVIFGEEDAIEEFGNADSEQIEN